MKGFTYGISFFGVASILILFVVFCLLVRPFAVESNLLDDEGVALSPKKIATEQPDSSKQRSSLNDIKITSQRPLSAADVDSVKIWDSAHGYFDSSDLQEYRSYSLETLETLGFGGDLKALKLLSDYHIKNGDLDAAFGNFKLAAAYGSTEALFAYSSFMGIYFRNVKSPELKENYAINALAFLAVAARRGDSYADLRGIADFKKEYGFYPSVDQVESIEKRALEIYSDLESLREELGLPEFDNTSNSVAQRAYAPN